MIMKFRPRASDGLWLCFLLPTAMMLTYINRTTNTHQSSYQSASILSWFLSIYSIYYALSKPLLSFQNSQIRRDFMNIFKKHLPAIVTMLVIVFKLVLMTLGILGFLLCIFGLMAYKVFLPKFFSTFKYSFSYGEGCLVLQSLVVFIIKSFLCVIHDENDPSKVDGSFNIIANVGLISVLVLCTVPYIPMLAFINSSTVFYLSGSSMILGLTLPYLWIRLMRNPVGWIIEYIWTTRHLLLLFFLWILCTLAAVLLVTKRSAKASTAYRKYFHALIVIVFTSGVFIDVSFLYLSSIVGLCIMVLLEHMRFKNIEPIATLLNGYFKAFKDEKDQGDLVLTNIYLLAGVSLPLWLSADLVHDNPLILLSGVLSIGIGDAFASIIGSKFGQYRLMNTDKTLEGLVASIVSQIAFIKSLELFNLVSIPQKIAVNFSIMIVSTTEVITTQVDNIALPFLMYSLMRLFV